MHPVYVEEGAVDGPREERELVAAVDGYGSCPLALRVGLAKLLSDAADTPKE